MELVFYMQGKECYSWIYLPSGWGCVAMGRHTPYTPPPKMATAVSGTHPTGMHYFTPEHCFCKIKFKFIKCYSKFWYVFEKQKSDRRQECIPVGWVPPALVAATRWQMSLVLWISIRMYCNLQAGVASSFSYPAIKWLLLSSKSSFSVT